MGPKSWTLEGSPPYRGGTVVQFAQVQLVMIIIDKDTFLLHDVRVPMLYFSLTWNAKILISGPEETTTPTTTDTTSTTPSDRYRHINTAAPVASVLIFLGAIIGIIIILILEWNFKCCRSHCRCSTCCDRFYKN